MQFLQGISEMSVPAFANGGMNVTGLRLVDFTDSTVKSYLQGWSVVNRNVKVHAGVSYNKIIEVSKHVCHYSTSLMSYCLHEILFCIVIINVAFRTVFR